MDDPIETFNFNAFKLDCLCSISNFPSIAANKPGYFKSVTLKNPDLKRYSPFKLVVYPSGFNERTRDFIALFLQRHSSRELDIKFTCAFVHPDGRELYSKSTRKHLALESTVGWTTFCHRNQVLEKETGLLNNGRLTIKCSLQFFEPSESYPEFECLLDLSESFRRNFPDLSFSDFFLRSPVKSFEVHKSILSARSPVLKAMLSLPDDCGGEINVQNISSDGLKAMLEFIYTGTLGHVSLAIAYELYTAADKYGILCLKRFCSEILANKLSVDNALALLLLSHDAKDASLHQACLDCIVKNMGEIKGRLEWIDLMQHHPELANNVVFYMEHKLEK